MPRPPGPRARCTRTTRASSTRRAARSKAGSATTGSRPNTGRCPRAIRSASSSSPMAAPERASTASRSCSPTTSCRPRRLFKPLEPNGWGWGIAVGTDRHLHRDAANGWPGDEYAYVPLSISFNDDAQVVHVNAGFVNRRDLDKVVGTWGIGSEIQLARRPLLHPGDLRQRSRAALRAGGACATGS